jgi:hypothetical protein
VKSGFEQEGIMTRHWAICLIIVAAMAGLAWPDAASAQIRYFRVCPGKAVPSSCGTSNDFVIALVTPQQWQMADDILSGKITDQIHVQGTIVGQPASYNAPWKFYLDPNSITFFTFGQPLCWGFSTTQVNANLSKVGSSAFLPTRGWCPRGYSLAEEVHPN